MFSPIRTYRPYSDGLPLMLAHLNLGLFVPSNVVQRSKESCYFTFCQYHSPVVSFFRPIPLLSIVWMKWVLFPTASI